MKKYLLLSTGIFLSFFALSQPTQPTAPIACNGSNCTTSGSIDVCSGVSTIVSDFRNASLFTNNGNSGLSVGSVWRFRNIATGSGQTVNCVLTIDAISQAVLVNIDDDGATDQAGNSIIDFFAPQIRPDQNLNGTDRRGYVQFTAAFFKNASGINNNTVADFAVGVTLANINYVHYDIDGSDASNVTTGSAGSWFRETGVAKKITATNPTVVANVPTELSAYNYTDPALTSWSGFAGSVCERTGVSRCAQVAVAYLFSGAQPSITFRMGYDYNAGGNIGQPSRQYGSRFGCFNFPQQSTLPVRLLSFSGSYKNNSTLLHWEADNQIDFANYEVERSTNAVDFSSIATKAAQLSGASKENYQYTDALSSLQGNVFYYRLKMVDIDGRYKYSNVIMIKRDQKNNIGVTINPNPVIGSDKATVNLKTVANGNAELKVLDLSGRILLRQQNRVTEGINSITLNNLDRLQAGLYILQVLNGSELNTTKFTIGK